MAPQRTFLVSGVLNEHTSHEAIRFLGDIVLEGMAFSVTTEPRVSKDKRPYQALSGTSSSGETIKGALFTFNMTAADKAAKRPCLKGKVNRGEKVYNVAGWYNNTPSGEVIRLGENKRKGAS